MQKTLRLAVLALLVGVGASVTYADHSFSGFHWARTANPFTLELGDNVSPAWDSYLANASSDWSVSTVLNTVIKVGKSKARTCLPTSGRVEVCSHKYGLNGWLGLTQVWTIGDHIVQSTVQVNDTYFATKAFNTPAWRTLALCHEIGHTLGLAHQDEIFENSNLDTCLDYTNDPSTNQHPNAHDYEELEAIYAHLDDINTTSTSTPKPGNGNGGGITVVAPTAWGKAVQKDAQGKSLYICHLDTIKILLLR